MPASDLAIARAGLGDLDALVPLFDGYRVFYEQPSNMELAHTFLSERLKASDSVILIATQTGGAVGFTQLYPSFSSTRACRIFVLNDLYVIPSARKTGAGEALLDGAKAYALNAGAARLTLSTAHDNHTAQSLYERNGWVLDTVFRVYNFALKD